MGHYAAEMQCLTCSKIRCICEPKGNKVVDTEKTWIVNEFHEAETGASYICRNNSLGLGFYNFMIKEHYASENEANIEAVAKLKETIDRQEKTLEENKKQLNVLIAKLSN